MILRDRMPLDEQRQAFLKLWTIAVPLMSDADAREQIDMMHFAMRQIALMADRDV